MTLAVNQQGVSTAAVTLNTPSGPQVCNFLVTYDLGTYSLSQYFCYNHSTYTPGVSYSVTISCGRLQRRFHADGAGRHFCTILPESNGYCHQLWCITIKRGEYM